MIRAPALVALLALAAGGPLMAQDTIRIERPITMTVIPVAPVVVDTVTQLRVDTLLLERTDTVRVERVDTVEVATGGVICRERDRERQRLLFSWSDWTTSPWRTVPCPPGTPLPRPDTLVVRLELPGGGP